MKRLNELLKEKRQFLSNNADAEDNIKKSAEVNVRKAERGYLEALKRWNSNYTGDILGLDK